MSIEKVWVLAEVADGSPVTTSLELLTAARSLGSVTEAVTWGPSGASVAPTLGEYGASTVYDVGDIGDALAGSRRWPARSRRSSRAGTGPDALLVPATYDGRDVAGRLSARLDLPVITNVVGLAADGDDLRSEHAIFGGSQVATAHFTSGHPWIFVVRAKSFCRGAGRGDDAAGRARAGTRARCDGQREGPRAPRGGARRVRSSTRPRSSFQAGEDSGRPRTTP